MDLKEFSKEERILFGLNITEIERNKKRNMSKSEEAIFNKKIDKLIKEREEFLKELEK